MLVATKWSPLSPPFNSLAVGFRPVRLAVNANAGHSLLFRPTNNLTHGPVDREHCRDRDCLYSFDNLSLRLVGRDDAVDVGVDALDDLGMTI
jgi:hypothetical protein